MSEDKDNLRLYNQFRNVPKEALKQFNNGRFSGTDINPMWRIKVLTEAFGACGEGWYFGKPEFTLVTSGDTITVHCVVALYHKLEDGTWSQPVYGVGGNTIASTNKNGFKSVTDEGYKMAYTDACGIAAKQLGVGADVWFSNDVTKYTAQQVQQQQVQQPIQQSVQQQSQQTTTQCIDGMNAFKFDTKKAVDDFFASLDDKKKKAAKAYYETVEYTNKQMANWGAYEYDLVCYHLIESNRINRETGIKIA